MKDNKAVKAKDQMVSVQVQISAEDYADMLNHFDNGHFGKPNIKVQKVLTRNSIHEQCESEWRKLGRPWRGLEENLLRVKI